MDQSPSPLNLRYKARRALTAHSYSRHPAGAGRHGPTWGCVLRWNCAKVIANIDDLAMSTWALKVIDELSQIDDI